MQTSCGSPCYAAPELVISEGLYVGSAVDIWSCGVILYAMLAGYLPFDDDPANPDGDNINLLYKYIVNTPLSFPDYISEEARDLLGMMLVPDPSRRASLEGVMRHPWLALYAGANDTTSTVPMVFGRTVEELERAAMEQHQMKRLAYQKQMKAAAAASASSPTAYDTSRVSRSQSQRVDVFNAAAGAVTSPTTGRSRSTQPEYLYETSVDQSFATSAPTPTSAPASGRRPYSPTAMDDDDPFAAPVASARDRRPEEAAVEGDVRGEPRARRGGVNPGAGAEMPASGRSSKTLVTPAADSPEAVKSAKKTGGGFRHTIQVEYDEPQKKSKRKGSVERERERRPRERTASQGQGQSQVQNGYESGSGRERKRPSQGSMTTKPLPPSPLVVSSPVSAHRERTPTKSPIVPRGQSVPVPVPITTTPVVNVNPASPPDTPSTPIVFADMEDRDRDTLSRSSSKASKHRKGRSSMDKLGLGKIFGNSSATNGDTNGRVPSDGSQSGQKPPALQPPSVSGSNSNSSSLLSPAGSGSEKEGTLTPGKKSRRNTLTVMVEPISRSIKNRTKGRMASTPTPGAESESGSGTGSWSGREKQPDSAMLTPLTTAPVVGTGKERNAPSFGNASRTDIAAGGTGMQASTSKARKVMQWFRTKSKGRDSVGIQSSTHLIATVGDVEDEKGQGREKEGTPTQAKYRGDEKGASSTTVNQTTPTSSTFSPVQLFVTTPTSVSPRSPPSQSVQAPMHPQRTPSSTTTDASFVTPSLVSRFRNSVTVGGGSNGSSSARSLGGVLRIHHGAVDQTTITTRAPPQVMRHVKEVLEGMGVEIQVESEYKYRCIRAKRRKVTGGVGLMGSVAGVGGGSGSGLAAFTMVGSAASNGVSDMTCAILSGADLGVWRFRSISEDSLFLHSRLSRGLEECCEVC